MKPILFSALTLSAGLLSASCGSSQANTDAPVAADTPFKITGTVAEPQADGWIKLVELDGRTTNTVDSTKAAEDGSFSFEGQVTEPSFYAVNLYDQQRAMLVLSAGDELQVTAGADGEVEVTGSEYSDELRRVNALVSDVEAEMGGIVTRFDEAATDAEREELRGEMMTVRDRAGVRMRDLIRSFDGSLPAYYAKDMLYAPVFPGRMTLSDPVEDVVFLDSLTTRFEERQPESRYAKTFREETDQIVARAEADVNVGEEAPEISLPTPGGETVSLTDLRGKYVLVDFWASWCGPCRQENPNVVRAYNQYKGEEFEILGVSLDQKRDRWLKAIDDDKLTWPHVSDLKGWQSAAAANWNVQAIPASFLIDPEGKVIAKNLRGQALEDKLAELFPQG
ncbi:MAG: TlpA disulfide reductase family protein [Catalinimonas sp.]